MSPRTPRRRPADAGTLLSTTHEVDGGLRVRLRLARPSDAPRLRGLCEEDQVRHLTFFDPRERLVVAATAMIGPREEILGVADLALLDPTAPEPGLLVDERVEGLGVDRVLGEAVGSLATRRRAA